jgi:hypothetical protein
VCHIVPTDDDHRNMGTDEQDALNLRREVAALRTDYCSVV